MKLVLWMATVSIKLSMVLVMKLAKELNYKLGVKLYL